MMACVKKKMPFLLSVQHDVLSGLGRLFYVISPAETSFEKVEDVPDFVNKAIPYFVVFLIVEVAVLHLQGKALPRHNDGLSSISAGILSLLPVLLAKNIEKIPYIWVWSDWSLYRLSWHSSVTWWLCMLGVDFCYYWVHRLSHEVNFMWAAHQVHHSSEDYNLTTALRQSVLQRYVSWMLYLPLAFFIPPSICVVHLQFNVLYQFWIHTECVKTLGPLEWVLNTPSHHRVHHGRNRYCIDKNYGGTLIIWDRIFGTFEGERDDDTVVYGLVHPLNSWDPIYTQLSHWRHMADTVRRLPGLRNKMAVFVNGPGWAPGKPRLGETSDIPDVHSPVLKYDKTCRSVWISIYAWIHFVGALVVYEIVAACRQDISYFHLCLGALFVFWTFTSLGHLYECRKFAPHFELFRCVTYLIVDYYVRHTDLVNVTSDTWVTSAVGSCVCDILWLSHLLSGAVWFVR
ncbi:hypothetical protein NP493_439g01006 [Ridgeia piscesae]|uniref:Alkylglycerol monooxygenase n=1 Tax=Ridgeia piscesae TaxID=27915 RepID=A0AAD9L081_RIDPI|nr:hypothetical protein NP493_439g01006 [Ridgeia piscesae]